MAKHMICVVATQGCEYATVCTIPASLASLLEGMTPEQMQEIETFAVLLFGGSEVDVNRAVGICYRADPGELLERRIAAIHARAEKVREGKAP